MRSRSEQDEIIEKRARGESISSIAQKLNISCSSVACCIAESAHLVTNAINLEKDAFLERIRMTAPKRLEQKVELMKKIVDELLARDLSQVPAEKLMDMLFRLEDKTGDALKVTVGKIVADDPFDDFRSLSQSTKRLVVTDV